MIKNIKTYINENKFLKVSLICFAVISFITVSRLAIQEKKSARVKAFRVSIAYKDKTKRLINADYIRNEVRKSLGYDVERIKLGDLDLKKIEDVLVNNDYVKDVEVYLDGRNYLRAEIRQKNPIVRVEGSGRKFYLDEEGQYLALSPLAAVRVPIFTGNVVPYDPAYQEEDEHQFQEILKLSKKINEDGFLTSLIEQVHIEKNGDFLLIPKIGKEKIMLGSTDELEHKMYKLKVFYKEGLTRVGWGEYAYLDLKYEDQVVAK